MACKCLAAYLACQLACSDKPRIAGSDPIPVKNTSTSEDKSPPMSPTGKDDQRFLKTTKQYVNHISQIAGSTKQYSDYKIQLQYTTDFIFLPSNTLMHASLLVRYFIVQFYSSKSCFCDVLHSDYESAS